MIKRTIAYIDFDGNERTEENHFKMVVAVRIGDKVQTIKGRGVVVALVDDFVVVDLDGDHGTYMFDKKSIWRIDI